MVALVRDVERRDGWAIGVIGSSPLDISVVFFWEVMAVVDMVCVRTCRHSNVLFLFIDKKNRQQSHLKNTYSFIITPFQKFVTLFVEVICSFFCGCLQ